MAEFSYDSLAFIPVSATEGDNITRKSKIMVWYRGKTLLNYLEDIDTSTDEHRKEFDACSESQPVTVLLDREVDVSRGCVFTKDSTLSVSRLFKCELLWMDNEELLEGRNYYIKLGTKKLPASVVKIHYKTDVNTGEHVPAAKGYKNEILTCDISLSEKIALTSFEHSRALGCFILIDRVSNMTSACGIINHPLRRSDNLTWQNLDITREIRARQKNQKPLTIWFTGLSGSGKSTLANALEKLLVSMGKHTMLLDGDNVRMGLNGNLGFSDSDRVENIRRIAEVSKLMNDAGLIVLVSAISPFSSDRKNAREIIGDSFVEIYVSTPLEECERRDVKGLYKKARAGIIPNFTGISSEYQIPEHPEFDIDTSKMTLETATDLVLDFLEKKFYT